MPSVLVTGAGRGIGKSIVEYVATRGWDVIAGVRTERDAAAVTALDPERISSVILDITEAEHIAALDELLPERLDAIVNNAGVVVAGPMETVTTEGWRKELEINVIGQLAVTRAALSSNEMYGPYTTPGFLWTLLRTLLRTLLLGRRRTKWEISVLGVLIRIKVAF